MLKDQKDLLFELNAAGVDYVVVGGHAVNAYGVPRMTKDLDVFIRSDQRNSEAVYKALVAFGAPLAGVSPEDFRDRVSIFQLGVEPSRIDIIQTIAGVTFEEVWKNRVSGTIDDSLPVAFISREDLIENKLESARPQDLADVDHLRRVATQNPVK